MAVIKCKMCGGDLNIIEGQSVLECEYCGSMQTVPSADNEKKMSLFGRANRLRSTCDFDKAAGIYESIVTEFPDEAEGYWGLVLCKYGIEYVDDPATGKKIPTCHRSSYDSVMEDSNFEQAMENADAVALRVYREEAKQIESIRKGILEVSSKEEPYDIFICYKETDEKGERTLDSVLAQDIYGALTDKGYRVFFSRITLKGKLGEAYEPYIFAALNSAKVMLAIGTCYEYFNAVWVKNEWSRYLKICAADKSKHLIPCYKNLDAYDMPNEFKPLQAVDLGQMGAIQDLLWNMEKYIPLKKQQVVQETVVMTGGNSKIESLLDRGNMALEDGDWAKADSFFEEVLNNDSKNAQAYVGKMLAAEKCRTMNAFIRRRKDYYSNATSEKKYILSKDAHIQEMVEKYSIPYYVDKNVIRKQYSFDLSYPSQVRDRKKQYADEETYWKNHKLLSRAEKFATGAVAENLGAQKKDLFDALNERVLKAETAEVEARERAQSTYASHIVLADQNVEALYQEGLERREREYQRCLDAAKNEDSVAILADAQAFFENQKDYKDCADLAKHCASRIADIRAEEKRLADIAAREAAKEAERQRILAEKEAERQRVLAEEEAERQRVVALKLAKQRKAKMKKIAIIVAVIVVAIIAAVIVVTSMQKAKKEQAFNDAMALYNGGQYEAAADAFKLLEGTEASKMVVECQYQQGLYYMELGQYEDAIETFEKLGQYSGHDDLNDLILESKRWLVYAQGIEYLNEGDWERGYNALKDLGDRNGAEAATTIMNNYKEGKIDMDQVVPSMREQGVSEEIIAPIEAILQAELDAKNAELKAAYDAAVDLFNAGQLVEAKEAFEALGDYGDSAEQVENCYKANIGEDMYNLIKNAKVGDVITFGTYEQDNNTSNGAEPLEWIVLDACSIGSSSAVEEDVVDDRSVFLISKYIIDSKQYKESNNGGTWNNSTLKSWLIGDFYNQSFTDEEKSVIVSTSSNSTSLYKVRLLSETEFYSTYSNVSEYETEPTAYAYANQGDGGDYLPSDDDDVTSWWLMNNGANEYWAALVKGQWVDSGQKTLYHGVRPVIALDMGLREVEE